MNRFPCVLIRWYKTVRNYLGFLHLACAYIRYRQLDEHFTVLILYTLLEKQQCDIIESGCYMSFHRSAQSRTALCFLVIPADGSFQHQQLAVQCSSPPRCMREKGARVYWQPSGYLGHQYQDKASVAMHQCISPVPFARFTVSRMYVLMNVGFLLSDTPPLAALMQQASEQAVAWCLVKSSHDTHAMAFTAGALKSSLTFRQLWHALVHLTACVDDDVESVWRDIAVRHFLAPSAACIENSPAMYHIADVSCRAPRVLPAFSQHCL